MRIAAGAEALVARVLTAEGVAGFGFTLNFEAIVAREMAAWDALARTREVPFYALFGKKSRQQMEIVVADAAGIDPFAGAPLEKVRQRAATLKTVALLAPNAHPWEIAYCAALGATLAGEVRIALPGEAPARLVAVPDAPGIGIDWSIEPGFQSLRWFPA